MVLNAYAYSGRWNNRRLEHNFHGLWQLIFNALIHDLRPGFQVISQLRLESRMVGRCLQLKQMTRFRPNQELRTRKFLISQS